MDKAQQDSKVLRKCIGRAHNLVELVNYSDDSIVSKTLLDKSAGTVSLFAFDTGQKLSEHTSKYDAVIQVLDGSALLKIGGKDVVVCPGQIIIMPANVPHAVTAQGRFKMLLTMIRA